MELQYKEIVMVKLKQYVSTMSNVDDKGIPSLHVPLTVKYN